MKRSSDPAVLDRAQKIVLNPDNLSGPLDWNEVYGSGHPVEIEVGFGKGGFLAASSIQHPGRNFLGLETAAKLVQYAAERLAKRGVENARVACVDAHYFVSRYVPDASVDAYHVYFPDPWPKKRHRKRRVLKEEFLREMLRTLKAGGRLYFATDFQDYFEQATGLFKSFPAFKPLDPAIWLDHRPPECVTNYEVKYRREGRPIYYALYERCPE